MKRTGLFTWLPPIRYPQRGGIAIMALMAFLVLAVPITTSSLKLADQLNRNSLVYDRRLKGMYNANAGAEMVFWQLLNDPSFDDGLTNLEPCKIVTMEFNGELVTVTACQVLGISDLRGQALTITKSVSPAGSQTNSLTTFTYTIAIRNEGVDSAEVKHIFDYLPPGFTYVAGSTNGLTVREPSANNSSPMSCGSKPYQLFWNVEADGISIAPQQELLLTFQATARLSPGTYYNQALVRYVPWWITTGTYVEVFTPFTAEVRVGDGTPYCGYNLNVRVTKEVQPATLVPGVDTEFTYMIHAENLSSGDRYICKIEDRLPPDFSYVAGSTGLYLDNIDLSEPSTIWNSTSMRWTLTWADGTGASLPPLAALPAGGTKTQVFKARATPAPGVSYFNEISAVWSKQLVGGHCKTGSGDGGASTWGGTIEGGSSEAQTLVLYDLTSVAADGTIRTRIQFYESSGRIEILSWQEY